MQTKTLLFFTFINFIISSSFANIGSIASLNELSDHWEQANETTLIIFDVDEVLITTEDHFSHPYAKYIALPLMLKFILTSHSKKETENSLSLSYLLTKKILIEDFSPSLIKKLQNNRVPVIALTHSATGPLGLIPEATTWKINLLKEYNIHFSLFEIDRLFIQNASQNKILPFLEQGVLFAEGHSKGAVLKAFFKQCNFHPLKVIFIDDSITNVEDVHFAMTSIGIECLSYQYTGANRFFKKEANKAILTYQFEYLLEKKQWLTDNEVQKKLSATN